MCRMTRGACAFLLLCFTILSSSAARAADWYVSTTGAAANSGAIDSPWDIESALDGRHAVAPGDTIWVRGGTYKAPWPSPIDPLGYGFLVKLTGAAGAPIHVRPHTGEHVTIDGGLYVQSPSSHLWIWDFEILVSEPRRVYGPTEVLDRPWGGVSVLYGTGLKFINLVLHDNCMGFGFWTPAIDSEIYGCLIYNNGYMLSDGTGMGPGIYTQNGEGGYKYITDNIIAGNYLTTGFKAYSSKAYVNN